MKLCLTDYTYMDTNGYCYLSSEEALSWALVDKTA